ncbi:ThiF family adenylyltransferase [Paenibacillus enshidis]|uniref:ThiF family adenylyltransferase n=1 Tax=Paenibacillus enshidis TaxID=1458439 RepID=A0ABV5AV85_9BACL
MNLLSLYKGSYTTKYKSVLYNIIILGCGGTGGYLVQRLSKMLYAFGETRYICTLVDPDTVEKGNLLRQPFLPSDIGRKKAEVLAERYGLTYGLRIGSVTDAYVESVDQLEKLFARKEYSWGYDQYVQDVLIGCVDNNYSRQVMNEYFKKSSGLIYIDAGIEGVWGPESPAYRWSSEEKELHQSSGYSGQVVVGLKYEDKVLLDPVLELYPVWEKDSIPPSHNCGIEPNQPQRMISNEMAALQISVILNELFASNSILIHQINFNAQLGNSRPVYVEN